MRSFGRFASLLLLAWSIFAPAQGAETLRLRIGTEAAYPPFEFRDPTGALRGFDIDIGNALCAELHAQCQWVAQDFDGLIPALKSGKIDVIIASMSVTPDRARAVLFTQPYYRSPSLFVARKGVAVAPDAEGLKDLAIGVQSGTVHQAYLEARFPAVSVKAYDTLESAALDLEDGRIDAILADKLAIADWLDKEGRAKGFAYAGDPIEDPTLSGDVAIAVRSGDTGLKGELDSALERILSNGAYDRINAAYFAFSIRPR